MSGGESSNGSPAPLTSNMSAAMAANSRRSARKRKRSVRTISPTSLDIPNRSRPRPPSDMSKKPAVKQGTMATYRAVNVSTVPNSIPWSQVGSQGQHPGGQLSSSTPSQQAAASGGPGGPVHLVGGSCIYCGFEIKKPWDLVTHMVEQHDVQISSLDCGDALPIEPDLTCPFCSVLFTIAHDLFYHLLIGHAKKIFGREAMSDYCTIEMLTIDHKKLTLKVRINRKTPLPMPSPTNASQIIQSQLNLPGHDSLHGGMVQLGTSANEVVIRGQISYPESKMGNLVLQGTGSNAGATVVTLATGRADGSIVSPGVSVDQKPGNPKMTQVYALAPQTSPGGTTTYHLVPSNMEMDSLGQTDEQTANNALMSEQGVPNLDANTIASITQQLQQQVAAASNAAGTSHSTETNTLVTDGTGALYRVVRGQAKTPINIVKPPRNSRSHFPLSIPPNLIPEAEARVRLHDKGYQCSQCFKVRESKEDAVAHVYKVHMCASLRRFQCSYCPKCYDNMKNLQTHVNACHAPTRMYACPTCPMKYKYPGDLKRHLSKNVCDRHKSGGFPCPKCGMMWYHQSALASHQRQCDGIQ